MRKNRLYSETGFYHVVIRGVNKQNIFYDSEDRMLFLSLLKRYEKKYAIRVHAFCLMDNHVHLEIEDSTHSLSVFMQGVCSVYARLFNRKYDRIGHLFQDRFASEVIKNESEFMAVFRYIMQNPMKAGLGDPLNYAWSSIHFEKFSEYIYKDLILEKLQSRKQLADFILRTNNQLFLEIELRPSERVDQNIGLVKRILHTDNPIIKPDLPRQIISEKIRKLKKAGLSVRNIARITGIPRYIVQIS